MIYHISRLLTVHTRMTLRIAVCCVISLFLVLLVEFRCRSVDVSIGPLVTLWKMNL